MTTKHFEVQIKESHEEEFKRFFQVASEEEGKRFVKGSGRCEILRLVEITTATETRVVEIK